MALNFVSAMLRSREDFDGAVGATAAALDAYAAGRQGSHDAADDFRCSSCLYQYLSIYVTIFDGLLRKLRRHTQQRAQHVCSQAFCAYYSAVSLVTSVILVSVSVDTHCVLSSRYQAVLPSDTFANTLAMLNCCDGYGLRFMLVVVGLIARVLVTQAHQPGKPAHQCIDVSISASGSGLAPQQRRRHLQ